MNSWVHDSFGVRYYSRESAVWLENHVYPIMEECVKIFDQPNLKDYSSPATANQADRASKAFEGLIIAIKAMSSKEIVVDGEIFYAEASKFLQTMSVTSKFKIKGQDSHANLFDYYEASENRCQIVLDSEKTNFIHRLYASFKNDLDPSIIKAIETNFEVPFEKIDVSYFFKVEPDAGTPPRCEPIHSPHIFRYGNIGFAFLICMPFDWAAEQDHYSVEFNYYKDGKYRSCKRRFSLLNGSLPYVRYMVDEWTWGDKPIDFVKHRIANGEQENGVGLTAPLANRITHLFYYVNIVWLIENDGLNLSADNNEFYDYDDLAKSAQAELIKNFEDSNKAFCSKSKAEFHELLKNSPRGNKYVDTETLLRHYGIIPVEKYQE